MRPYQIVAAERICAAHRHGHQPRNSARRGGGFIWHTTGSGKTLTSFKAPPPGLPDIDKVLFVDRKDLDYQTMRRIPALRDRCANSDSTAVLQKQQGSERPHHHHHHPEASAS
jgi:type I restriction enzyme R subunit